VAEEVVLGEVVDEEARLEEHQGDSLWQMGERLAANSRRIRLLALKPAPWLEMLQHLYRDIQ